MESLSVSSKVMFNEFQSFLLLFLILTLVLQHESTLIERGLKLTNSYFCFENKMINLGFLCFCLLQTFISRLALHILECTHLPPTP